MNRKRRTNWIVYLIFGIVITSCITTVTLSRYMTEASGNGTITVATLDTDISTLTFTPSNLKQPGDSETIEFNVTNFIGEQISGVDQNYSITVNTDNNLPFTYQLQCINTGSNGTGINGVINSGTQLSGGLLNHSIATTHQYVLTVTWPSNVKNISLAEELELMTITIDSEQIVNE